MNRQAMIDWMTARDVQDILGSAKHENYTLLVAIIQGDGWKPYGQMTDEEVLNLYQEIQEQFDADTELMYNTITN